MSDGFIIVIVALPSKIIVVNFVTSDRWEECIIVLLKLESSKRNVCKKVSRRIKVDSEG
jgi:hypothetical protein